MIGQRRLFAVGLLFLAACAGPGPTPAPGAPTPVQNGSTAASTATPVPSGGSAAPIDGGAGWTLVVSGDPASATQFTAVSAVDDGFVVVGSAGQAGELAIALRSTDGTTWTQDDIAGRGTSPRGIIPWNDGLLAVGGGQSDRCAHPGEMDVWVRAHDGTWTEAPFDQLFCRGASATPFVLDGRAWLSGSGVGDVPFLMESADGLSWTDRSRVIGDVFLADAAVDGSGAWIFGRAPDGSDVVLHSRDGARWTTTPLRDAAGRPLELVDASVMADRLTVLVRSGDRLGLLTPDGSGGWDEAAVTGLPSDGLAGIATLGTVMVAFDGGAAKPPGWWSSGDGRSWRPIGRPIDADVGSPMSGVAVGNGRAVAIGRLAPPYESGLVGAIWTAPGAIIRP